MQSLPSPILRFVSQSIFALKPLLAVALTLAAVYLVCFCALAQTRPAPVASAAKAAAPTSPFTIELYSTSVRFTDDGTGERHLDVRIHIGSDAGADELKTLSFRYNVAFETFSLSYFRVKKSDGTVTEAKPDAVADASATLAKDAPAFSDIHDVKITAPPLAPGDTLSYEVMVKTVKAAAPGEFWYAHNFLSGGQQASDEELHIEVPAARAIHLRWAPQFAPEVTTHGAEKIYSWKRTGKPDSASSAKGEDAQNKNSAPDVSLTSFADWPAVGKWLGTTVQNAATASPDITDKVQSLAASAKSDADKIEALYDFASKQIHLTPVTPEESQYQIRAASKVLADGYGDAYDKSALLLAMLGAAGFHGDMAFLSSNTPLDSGFPIPATLTQPLVTVSSGKNKFWLDPSEPTMPFCLLTPNLRSKQALVASTAAPPHFEETPADPPFLSTQRVDIVGRVTSLGILTARVQYALRGDNEYALRMAFYTSPKDQWKQLAQTMATLDGLRGQVVSVTPSDPTAIHDSFVLQFVLTDPEFLDWSLKQFTLALPFPTFGLPDAPSESSKPVTLGSPLDISARLSLTLPVTDSARVPAGSASTRDYAEYRSSYSSQDNVVTAERSLKFLKHEVPVGRAEDYAVFTHAVESDESQGIAVTNILPDIPADASPKDLMLAGGGALQSRKYANALRLFRSAQQLDPKQPGLWKDLGLAQLQLGQFADAEASFRKQMEADPKDESLNNLLGVALFDQKRFDEAAATFQKQISAKPLDSAAHSSLGAVYIAQDKFQAAASELEKAAALSPDTADIQVKLGEAYLGAANSQSALKAFDKAIALSPTVPVENEIAFSLAGHNVALDRAELLAKSALRSTESQLNGLSLKNIPLQQVQAIANIAAIWDTAGWVYFHQGKLGEAESYIAPAWRLDLRGDVGSHLAQIYEKRGDKALAIRTYTQALAAGAALDDTRARIKALGGSIAGLDARVKAAREELVRMHSVPLGKLPGGKKAAFAVLLEPALSGPVVKEAKFIGGDEGLASVDARLRAAKFPQLFPAGSQASIALRGEVACSAATLACQFIFQPPSQLLAGS
ncbi:MAG TPA: DUF3857 domain-containing protein [Candidatus Acidoferrales bacterium]|nr:DUF3857 domain-containing protein [Candidatus Acidoferrales bacterium]